MFALSYWGSQKILKNHILVSTLCLEVLKRFNISEDSLSDQEIDRITCLSRCVTCYKRESDVVIAFCYGNRHAKSTKK